jgi:hypothetical protein
VKKRTESKRKCVAMLYSFFSFEETIVSSIRRIVKNSFFCFKLKMSENQSKGQQGNASTIEGLSKMINLENLTLVWCDTSRNNNNQSQERQVQGTRLRRAINFLRIFTQIDECQAYIKEAKREKVKND